MGVSFVSSFGELPSIYPQKSLFFIGNMFDLRFGLWRVCGAVVGVPVGRGRYGVVHD